MQSSPEKAILKKILDIDFYCIAPEKHTAHKWRHSNNLWQMYFIYINFWVDRVQTPFYNSYYQ